MAKIKVIEATGSSSKTTTKIDLGIEDLPAGVRESIATEVGEYVVEQVLLSLGDADSPVSGERFPALSKKYKELKQAAGRSGSPDLEFSGDLKDSLTYRPYDGGVEVGWWGDQADKADGHLKFSGRTNHTPKRRALPAEGQSFKRDITKGVEGIVLDLSGDAFDKQDFEGVESSRELYDKLRDVYGDMPRGKIRMAVAGNPRLLVTLADLDLLEYL
jgi:hypothetical protein